MNERGSIRGVQVPDPSFTSAVAGGLRRTAELARSAYHEHRGGANSAVEAGHQADALELAARHVHTLPQFDMTIYALWLAAQQLGYTGGVWEPPAGSEQARVLSTFGVYAPTDPSGVGAGPEALLGELLAAATEDLLKQAAERCAEFERRAQAAEERAEHLAGLEARAAELEAEVADVGTALALARDEVGRLTEHNSFLRNLWAGGEPPKTRPTTRAKVAA